MVLKIFFQVELSQPLNHLNHLLEICTTRIRPKVNHTHGWCCKNGYSLEISGKRVINIKNKKDDINLPTIEGKHTSNSLYLQCIIDEQSLKLTSLFFQADRSATSPDLHVTPSSLTWIYTKKNKKLYPQISSKRWCCNTETYKQ